MIGVWLVVMVLVGIVYDLRKIYINEILDSGRSVVLPTTKGYHRRSNGEEALETG
jgi:hypothetical protein